MDCFLFKQVTVYIKRNIKVYFCVAFQFAIIICMLNIFLSTYFNIKQEQDALEKQKKNQEYVVEVSDPSFDAEQFDLIEWDDTSLILNADATFPFSERYLKQLEKKYREYTFNINITIDLYYLGQYVEDGDNSVKVIYSSECESVKMSKETEKILYDVNKENTINSKDFPHTLSEGVLKSIQGDQYDIDYIEEDARVIFLPLQAYNGLFHKKDLKNIILSIRPIGDSKVTADMLNDIIHVMETDNADTYRFRISNATMKFLFKVHYANNEVKIFTLISGILILLVMIGGIGVFSLVIDKRKKEIAICYALGECKKKLCLKSVLEISMLIILAYITGMAFSYIFMLKGIAIATVVVEPNWRAAVLLLGIVLLLIVITVIPVTRLIKKYSPCEILSGL